MAWKVFPLLVTSLLVLNAARIIYDINRKKTEHQVSNISPGEDVGLHSKELTPALRQGLENQETYSLSYADKQFQLYNAVETFVMFIGYPGSIHSLVGSILDAHPEIIIPHEFDVIENWQKYRSLRALSETLPKYKLFLDLHQLSIEQAMFGGRSSAWVTRSNRSYGYNAPGLWQGGYEKTIKVIGDKKGGHTALLLDQFGDLSTLEEISQVVQVPMKFIHVHRNPFDNIVTMMFRATESLEPVREEGVKINTSVVLDEFIDLYFIRAASNQRVRERYGDAVLDIPAHETVLRPRETLQRLCDHLQVTCFEDYFEKCSKILYGAPLVFRNTVIWTNEQKQRVTKMMKKYPFLKEYSFIKYPS